MLTAQGEEFKWKDNERMRTPVCRENVKEKD
jgi:hypothetical protein